MIRRQSGRIAGNQAMSSAQPIPAAGRLRFIDIARSVAILLMLEGHFVDLTLAEEHRTRGVWLYETWHYIRGMTAPMFFTVTGLVFAYLLTGARESGFWQVPRVRKGIQRAGELLFWGYLLQVNLRLLPDAGRMVSSEWLVAFHVLQCIGCGLLAMIAIFGLARRLAPRAMATCYALAALAMFLLGVWLDNQPGPIPATAPALLQNLFKGTYSVFPLAPWLGFTFYGAALGVIVRALGPRLAQPSAPAAMFLTGLGLKCIGWWVDGHLSHIVILLAGISPDGAVPDLGFHNRVGEILMVLGLLVWIENRYRPGDSWFTTIGRNTFPVYVGHVVVLYGGIFGIGLNGYLARQLNPWQAALGALLFLTFFALVAQAIDPLEKAWSRHKSRKK
jgi:uncharacterized membrane protein